MGTALSRLLWWGRDYMYVLGRQLGAALDRTEPRAYASSTTDKGPLLLLPGVWESWRFLVPLGKELAERSGRSVYFLPGLGYNRGRVALAAEAVITFLRANEIRDVAIVAHSKGGLIGKYCLDALDGEGRISKMIAVSAPFSGSRYAGLLPLPSLRDFAPKAELIRQFQTQTAANGRIVSIYARFDPHIPGGSFLKGAENIRLDTVGHFRILGDAKAKDAILSRL